jgi:acid phosphatase
MCLGLVGCTGSTGVTVQNPVLPPSITTEPANVTVTAGQSATFSVVASGTAPLSYQWQKNGANISGATSSGYTTPTTTTADNNSTFDVVVSNAVGSVTSHTAALIVNPAPVEPSITTQPASQTVTAGQTATFTVVASGTAPLSYQWQKNGANISGATSSGYTTPTTTTADNNSTFDVVVSNAVGSVTSHTATLTVTPSSSVSVVTNSLPSGQMQAAYVFPLQATGGTPPYTWSASASSVPLGLTLSPASGIVAGIPTVSGVFTLNVQVRDAAGGSGSAAIPMSIATPPPPPSTTLFGHAILVVEENHNYGDVVGSSSMPYLNSLISQFGLATQYYANTHPSIGNYFMLTTGQTLTNDDSQTPSSFPVSGNNVVRELLAAGKTWKSYAEDLPSVGYIGGNSGNYYVRHNPLAYLTDVQNSPTQQQNLVPFTQFAADLASGSLPNYSFIVPNACHDAHNCDLGTADNWLKTNLDPLIKNSAFQNDGLLIIAFDESADDDTDGGGRIAVVLISPRFSKVAFQSTILYQHETVLRLMLEGLGATTLPGSAATAPTAWDFFAF